MDWTQVVVALAVGLPATLAAIGAIIQGLRNSSKIDENTKLTKLGTTEATVNAKTAAQAAHSAKVAAESLSKSFDGELDVRIKNVVASAVDPLRSELKAHAAQDERNMVEIRDTLHKLTRTAAK